MKNFKTTTLLFICLCLSQFSNAQTLTFSEIEACPGETVTLMVSVEDAPSNFAGLDFRFVFDYDWGNVNVTNIDILTPGFGHTNYDLQTNTFTYSGGYAEDCSIDLGSSFDVVAIDIKILNSATGCVGTNTSYVHLDIGEGDCLYTEVPTGISEGFVCASEDCDPCCAPPSLPLEFSVFAEVTQSGQNLNVYMCLNPRNDCPDIEYLFRYRLETNPDWAEVSGPNCIGITLNNIPGIPYIFEGAYLNPTCMTEWTTIEYVTPLICDGEETKIHGTVRTIHHEENCENTDGAISGANVVVYNEDGDVYCDSSTGTDGVYSCDICEDSGTYTVCVETTCDEPCGLKASDLTYLRKLILGILPITDRDIVVGDINGDGTLSNLDLVCMQRNILGLVSGPGDFCYIENWCRFVSEDELDNPDYDNCITVDSNDPTSLNVNFVRAMLGDLNGSCDDCIHGDDKGPLKIVSEDNGDVLTIKPDRSVGADLLFLEIKLAASAFEVSKVSGTFQNIDFTQEDGWLKISAYNTDLNQQLYSSDDALISIEGLRQLQDIGLNQEGLLILSDDADMNVLFDGQDTYAVSMGHPRADKRNVNPQKDVSLELNTNVRTLTIYSGQTDGKVTMTVQNILGQQIHSDQFRVTQGINTIPFDIELPITGVYVLTLYNERGEILVSQKFFGN